MLFMAAFVLLWASVEALAADLLDRYSPYQVVWTRYAVHLAFMLLVWGRREPATLWRTRRPVFQLSRALLMLAMPASWVLALQGGTRHAELMSVFWLAPLMILGLGFIMSGERPGWRDWVAAAAAYLGALLILEPHRWRGIAALGYPIVMGFTFAAYVVMTRSLRTETTRANLFFTALGVFLPLSVAMPWLWITPRPADLARMTVVGLLGWVTLYALDRATAAAPVRSCAVFAYLQLPATLVLASVWGGGWPHMSAMAGLVAIASGLTWTWVRWAPGRNEESRERAA